MRHSRLDSFRFWLIITIGSLLLTQIVLAAPVAPTKLPVSQPDGTEFIAIPRGDEYGNWLETDTGHTIVQKGNTWFYAVKNPQGDLVPGPYAVGALNAAELQVLPIHLTPNRQDLEQRTIRKLPSQQSPVSGLDLPAALSHTQNVLVILVEYTDQSFTYSDASFQSLMFDASDSVKEFFLENSYDGFTIVPAAESFGTANDGIIHVSRPVAHPNQGLSFPASQAEAAAIVALADSSIDYAAFDTNNDDVISSAELSIVIIQAGYENSFGGDTDSPTPRVWGHASGFGPTVLDAVSLSPYTMFGEIHGSLTVPAFDHQATIGIMCHELGHLMFGLPDLYDLDGSTRGIGHWGLMGGGSWNFTGSNESGTSPAHLSAWSKITTQITTPTEITADQNGVAFTDAAANESATQLWIDTYRVREYFLIENRQQNGYDSGLPGEGLMIWHIDESQSSNADEARRLVDLEPADNVTDIGDATDPFYSGNSTTFNDASSPDSKNNDGESTGIAISGISASAASMTADIVVKNAQGDHVRYDENGNNSSFGSGVTTAWMGLNVLNDTGLGQLDGIDILITDSAGGTIDVSLYQSIAGGTPNTLIYSETGLAVSGGWNRILLATPQSFPNAAERGLVIKVNNTSNTFPYAIDTSGTASGRSYFDADGLGTFAPLCAIAFACGDLNLVALMGSAVDDPPQATVITPTNVGPTNASSVDFSVQFSEPVVNFNNASDVVISHTGTANSGVSITGSDANYTVSVTGITGDGSFTLAASTGSDIEDSAAQGLASSVTSAAVAIDNMAPSVSIGSPSAASTNTGPVTYTVTYSGADSVSLAVEDVSLNKTGTANGTIGISGSGKTSRTVTISSITGTGSLGISIAAGSASDTAGNLAPAAGPSSTFFVDNTLPVALSVAPETTGPTKQTTVRFDVEFSEAVMNFNDAADLVISHTGTANTGVSITGSGRFYDVDITGISGTGSFTLAISTASDIEDSNGNALTGSLVSAAVAIDNMPPSLAIGAPSVSSTINGPVTYTVTYTGADAITLGGGDVSLVTTGDADASTVQVTGSGTLERTVTLSGITGTGTIGIQIAASTASDTAGNNAAASGASTTFTVGETLPNQIFEDGFEAEE